MTTINHDASDLGIASRFANTALIPVRGTLRGVGNVCYFFSEESAEEKKPFESMALFVDAVVGTAIAVTATALNVNRENFTYETNEQGRYISGLGDQSVANATALLTVVALYTIFFLGGSIRRGTYAMANSLAFDKHSRVDIDS